MVNASQVDTKLVLFQKSLTPMKAGYKMYFHGNNDVMDPELPVRSSYNTDNTGHCMQLRWNYCFGPINQANTNVK